MDYAPNTEEQLEEMLRAIGASSFEELISTVPADLRLPSEALLRRSEAPASQRRALAKEGLPQAGRRELDVPDGLAEAQVVELCERLAGRNRSLKDVTSFLGAGAYQHLIPTVVDALAGRGEWLTPYTPYQAEASQGTLQAIYEFQTMVCELLQMEVANASLYDGASSVAEAVLLAMRATQRPRVLVSEALHPHARETLATYLIGADAIVQEIPAVHGITDLEALGKALGDDAACVVLQQPNVFGCLEPMSQAGALIHRVGGLFIASVYPISLGLLKPPGAYGADIAVAEGRCLGSPVAYGGPGLGLFATTSELLRRIPGRLAGCTADQRGRRGFTLTLQTREQHIRRERATSNICTNEGWLALRATIFLSLLGPVGMQELARLNVEKAHYARERLVELPWVRAAFDHQPFFNEFTLEYDAGISVDAVNRALAKAGIVGGFPL
ncbi:MAG: glycine dehydrogenase (aminomethyl-transferring), partial [Omnitrophica WOR_2 bacterium RIFCSPHIGHO2_02_FULL_67_20]